MKREILRIVMVAAIVVTAGWNISQNINGTNASDLALNIVEALANNESGGGYRCSVSSNCYGVGGVSGSVSCTGSTCSRGSGGAFSKPWVECDGRKTSC